MKHVEEICPWGTADETGIIRGAVADDPLFDPSDRRAGAVIPTAGAMVITHNRDTYAPTAMDQRRSNGCVSGSGGYVHAYTEAKARRIMPAPRSFLFGWYYARPRTDRKSNVGCQLRDFWTVARTLGLPSEDAWPSDRDGADLLARASLEPSPESLEEAARWQTTQDLVIADKDTQGIASALMAGHVVHTSRPVYESFYDVGPDGIVPRALGRQIGWHAEAWWDIDIINGRAYAVVCGTYGTGFGKLGWYYLDLLAFGPYTADTHVAIAGELPTS